MTARRLFIASFAVCASASASRAEPIAVGVAPSAYLLSTDAWGFAPELLGHTYVPLPYDKVFLRPGARLSTRGLIQNDMSTDLRLEEHDLSFSAELGIVHSGRVVPSLTLLAGMTHRWVSLSAEGVDTSMSHADATEWLPSFGAQLGVGLPLHERVMIEPFARYEVVIGDARTHLRWGFEATFSFGR
jgi:hypothetical protein